MKLFYTCFALIFVFGCNSKKHDAISKDQNQDLSKWFTSKEVAEKVFAIDDHGSDNFYLIEGSDSALLIDNGIGAASVRDYIASLTKLPIIVVNTHGHPDHSGANYQFPLVYGHPDDFAGTISYNTLAQRRNTIRNAHNDPLFSDYLVFKDTIGLKPTVLKPVREGRVFDLGNRKLEVIEVPGHTPGSICLLDKQNKLLFAGDNSNLLVWLFLNNSEPLEIYLQSLKKLNARNEEYNTIFPGHGDPIDKTFIEEQIGCVENILKGSCSPTNYQSTVGNALLCTYKRSSVAYSPNNLFIKK